MRSVSIPPFFGTGFGTGIHFQQRISKNPMASSADLSCDADPETRTDKNRLLNHPSDRILPAFSRVPSFWQMNIMNK